MVFALCIPPFPTAYVALLLLSVDWKNNHNIKLVELIAAENKQCCVVLLDSPYQALLNKMERNFVLSALLIVLIHRADSNHNDGFYP